MGISSKPLGRQALRPSVGCVSRVNCGQSDALALIGGRGMIAGDMKDSDPKPDIASVVTLTVSQPLCLQFVTIEHP